MSNDFNKLVKLRLTHSVCGCVCLYGVVPILFNSTESAQLLYWLHFQIYCPGHSKMGKPYATKDSSHKAWLDQTWWRRHPWHIRLRSQSNFRKSMASTSRGWLVGRPAGKLWSGFLGIYGGSCVMHLSHLSICSCTSFCMLGQKQCHRNSILDLSMSC